MELLIEVKPTNDLINSICNACEYLDKVDDYIDSLNTQLSVVDSKICDLEHLIEHNNISSKGAYRIVKELKKCTTERRKIKNDMEIARVFQTNNNKLVNIKNREFLITEINKANSKLNKPYNNRVYTQEELDELLGLERKNNEEETRMECNEL